MTIKIGKVEKIFAGLLVLAIILSFLNVSVWLRAAVNLPLYGFGAWTFFRVSRAMVRTAMWRLRNRLIIAYLFIGLVPVVLIVTLAGLGGYLVGGQLSVFLVTSELERRTTALRSISEFILR